MNYPSIVFLCLCVVSLNSCGTAIPDMQEPGQSRSDEAFSEIELVQLIECELHVGVKNAIDTFGKNGSVSVAYPVDWLNDWQAQVSLKVTVDDKSSLSPGVTWIDPMANAVSHFDVTYGQNFSLTAGLQVSSQATRVETVAYTVPFSDFTDARLPPHRDCKNQIKNKVVLDDLKIQDFILSKAQMAAMADSVSYSKAAPFSAFNDELTFIVTYSGNLTPVWKLMRVTANATSPLYNATRTRTHDLTITLSHPHSAEGDAVHNAQLIGQAVAASLRNH